ncbi:MAG: anthranilate synthase component I family protein [Chitinophagales bacterium]
MPESYSFDSEASFERFFKKALFYADQFECFCLLNGNDYQSGLYQAFPIKLAIGAISKIEIPYGQKDLSELKERLRNNKNELFGIFSYELKDAIETSLSSQNPDRIEAPAAVFFTPAILLEFNQKEISISSDSENADAVYNTIQKIEIPTSDKYNGKITSKITREDYLEKIRSLQKHIKQGDIYEVNFCMEFFAKEISLNPIATYDALNKSSASPFSALFKWNAHYLISASPERFLQKKGNKLLSQPIKGTRKRSADPEEDKMLAKELLNDPKEQAENVMIVDLVRNDLTPFAKTGSIRVEELFGIYSFPHVHQMISTVSAELENDNKSIDALLRAFPMGSMTGAPKLKAMELIEKYEESKRGWYSGALGYFDKNGDFDLSVVIRSIVYNRNTKTASFQAGSAITYDAIPEKEYEECLLKAEALKNALRCQ